MIGYITFSQWVAVYLSHLKQKNMKVRAVRNIACLFKYVMYTSLTKSEDKFANVWKHKDKDISHLDGERPSKRLPRGDDGENYRRIARQSHVNVHCTKNQGMQANQEKKQEK